MPTYRVDRPGCDMPRVVVAAMPQAARLHVANTELHVRRIEVDEAFELAGQGVQLERAGEDVIVSPEPEPQGEEQQEPGMTNGGNPGAADETDEEEEGDGAEFMEQDDSDEGASNGGLSGEPAFYGEDREPFDAGDEELEGN